MVVAAYTEDIGASLLPAPPRRNTGGAASSISPLSAAFVDEQRQKALARKERFANAAATPPPPLKAKRIAWAGGKITSNKEAAVEAFIQRKRQAERLSVEEEATLRASLQRPRTSEPMVKRGSPKSSPRVSPRPSPRPSPKLSPKSSPRPSPKLLPKSLDKPSPKLSARARARARAWAVASERRSDAGPAQLAALDLPPPAAAGVASSSSAAAAGSGSGGGGGGGGGSKSRALVGRVFALSVGGPGVDLRELTNLIRSHGGAVSNTVHRKVDFVLASEQAIKRDTQTVRKAHTKFGIPILRPSFVEACVRAGGLCDPADHLQAPRKPKTAAAAQPSAVPASSTRPLSAPQPCIVAPAPAAAAATSARTARSRTNGRVQVALATVGRQPRMPWILRRAMSMGRWDGLACIELALFRRAQRKHAARACAVAKRALRELAK